jgi:ABC-2 type transport system ATP-binding protein
VRPPRVGGMTHSDAVAGRPVVPTPDVAPGHDTAAGNVAALAVRGLTKRFGSLAAVDDVSLDIPRGSFFGLVGPNGAGKTTLLSMAVGLLRPDGGHALIDGHDVWGALPDSAVEAKRRVGVLPDGLRTFDRLTGAELLTFTGLLRGLDTATVATRTAELLDVLGLADAAGKLVIDYSAGMTKKIGLAQAMLHAPRLLVLDEPFEAVDPISAQTIREILARYVAGGGTVVFSSHVMELVERLCDRVAVMAAGRIVATGTLDEVRGGRDLAEVFVDLVGGQRDSGEGLAWLGSSPV